MALIALLIGAIIVVAAIRNSQDALFSALKTDVPHYAVWAAAIFTVGAIGYVPGLKPVSRGLLALIFIVIILHDYQQIITGFQNAWKTAGSQSAGSSTASGNGSGAGTTSADPSKPATGSTPSSSQSDQGGELPALTITPSAAAGVTSSIVQNAFGSLDSANAFGSFSGVNP